MPHKDPAVRRAYRRAYREKNSEQRKRHSRIYDAKKHANDRARVFGVPGTLTTTDVRAILHSEAQCNYCGAAWRLTLDHVIAMSNGGPNTPENIVAACLSCNASKMRSDRPWRWAWNHDHCIDCGTTERKHEGHGRCERCFARVRSAARRPSPRPRKTHCVNGHERTPENVYVGGACKICTRIRSANRDALKRGRP